MTTTPVRDDAGDTTEARILEAAIEVFADKGFEAASFKDIADRAGTNRSALNYHHDSKDALYHKAVQAAYRMCCVGMPSGEFPDGDTPLEKLTYFIGGMVRHMVQDPNPAAVTLMMREMFQPRTPACAEWVERYIRPVAGGLRAVLREVLPGASDRQLWMAGFSIVGQCLYYRQNRRVVGLLMGQQAGDELYADVDRLAAHVARFSLGGLAAVAREELP